MRRPMPVPSGLVVKNGSKYLFRQIWRKPYSGISDRYKNLVVFSPLRLDGYLAYAINVLCRLDAVDD